MPLNSRLRSFSRILFPTVVLVVLVVAIPLTTTGQRPTFGRSILAGAYWYIDERTDSLLEITNNEDGPREVQPILLVNGRESLILPSVSLRSLETRRIRLGDYRDEILDLIRGHQPEKHRVWGDGSRDASAWGAIALQGAELHGLSSWVLVLSSESSLSIPVPLARPAPRPHDAELVAMWWTPTANTQVSYSFFNPSSESQKIEPFLLLDGGWAKGRQIHLKPFEAKVVSLEELAPGRGPSEKAVLPALGTIRFRPQFPELGLSARGMMIDEGLGMSTPFSVRSLRSLRGSELQSAGASLGQPDPALGFPDGIRFLPHLLITNLSNQPRSVELTLRTRNDDVWIHYLRPFEPGESRAVNLLYEHESAGRPLGDAHVGVELRHDGDGDMMAELITLDETMDYSFYDPMFAVQSQAAQGQVAISFDLSGTKNTLLVFKNTTDGAVSYIVAVQYEENGEWVRYEAQPATLTPQAPGVINLRTLRDRGVADRHGRVLPPDLQFGNALLVASSAALIAGDPTFDPVNATCASCTDPCREAELVEVPPGEEGSCGCEFPPPPLPPPPAPRPTNFHQVSVVPLSGGSLLFGYEWSSSDGNISHLGSCEVGELVTYSPADIPFPSPPFPVGNAPDNPTVIWVPGTDGGLFDLHDVSGQFVKPYVARSITANQTYRYHCSNVNNDAITTLVGGISITRQVSQKSNGDWKYTLTKSGASASIDPLP